MDIPASTRHYALMRIFRRRRHAAKPFLLQAELQRAWIHLGLRQADLALALREAAAARLLQVQGGGGRIELSKKGREELGLLGTFFSRKLLDWLRLERIRRRPRQHTGSDEFRLRRVGDRLGAPPRPER